MDEENVLMCIRVEDAHSADGGVEGSIQIKCDKCESAVWISPSGQKHVAKGGCTVWCLQCANEEVKDRKEPVEATVLPDTIEELFDQLLRDAEKGGLQPKPVYDMICALCGKK